MSVDEKVAQLRRRLKILIKFLRSTKVSIRRVTFYAQITKILDETFTFTVEKDIISPGIVAFQCKITKKPEGKDRKGLLGPSDANAGRICLKIRELTV